MEILQLLKSHDYYYMMSDDSKVWERGRAEEKKIMEHIKGYTPEQILPFIEQEWVRDLIKQRFFVGE